MNCPVCKITTLEKTQLEADLPSMNCNNCGGNWIGGALYWGWLETHQHKLPERAIQSDESVNEVRTVKLCPQCNSIMVKYWVGHGVGFSLDHCHSCRGIWFDQNEWEALKNHNLHDEINSIFTEPWQTAVEKEKRRRDGEQRYLSKFGMDDYAEMKRIHSWLERHPRREEILAYLSDPTFLD